MSFLNPDKGEFSMQCFRYPKLNFDGDDDEWDDEDDWDDDEEWDDDEDGG